jgi:hypothetical protein
MSADAERGLDCAGLLGPQRKLGAHNGSLSIAIILFLVRHHDATALSPISAET